MSLGQRIIRNTLYILISNIFIKLLNFVFLLVAAQKLAEASFGKFGTVNTIAFLFTLLANLGFQPMSVKELSRNKENAKTIFLNIFTIRLSFALAGLTLYLFIATTVLSYEPDVIRYMLIVAATIVLNPLIDTMNAMFIAHEKMWGPALLGTFLSFFFNFFAVLILLTGGDSGLPFIFLLQVVSAIVTITIYYQLFKRHFFPIRLHIDTEFAGALVKRTLPFGILAFLIVINSRLDQFMLSLIPGGRLLDLDVIGLSEIPLAMSAVAYYTIPFRLFDSLAMMLDSIRTVIYPVISTNFERNFKLVIRTFHQLFRLIMTFYSIPMFFAAFYGAEKVLVLFFTEKYAPSSFAMKIQAGTYAINSMNVVILPVLFNSKYVTGSGGAMKLILLSFLAISINAVLNILLIPGYSYIGAAWATLTSVSFLMLVKLILVKKTFNLEGRLFPAFNPLLIVAVGIMLGSYHLLSRLMAASGMGGEILPGVAAIVVSIIVYYAAIFILGIVDDAEKKQLKSVLKRVLVIGGS